MRRALDYIELGVKEGARLAHGGRRALAETGGFYVEPTILDDATNSMRIAQEEIFGPVVVVVPFETEAEAVRLANDTIYGLAAAVWTRDMDVAHRLTRAIRAGTVWVNTYDRSSLTTPFGGFKQSGLRSRPLAARDRQVHGLQDDLDALSVDAIARRRIERGAPALEDSCAHSSLRGLSGAVRERRAYCGTAAS